MGLLSTEDKVKVKNALPKKRFKIICGTKTRLYLSSKDSHEYKESTLRGAILLVEHLIEGGQFWLKIVDLTNDEGEI